MYARLLTLLILLAAPTLTEACTVPVFRYALERWDLSRYELTVFYERVLPAEIDRELKKLEAGKANVTIQRVDLQGDVEPVFAKHWGMQDAKKTLPWIALRLPDSDAKLPDAWAGPCTVQNLRHLIDSPGRQKLVQHLSAGMTAVFMVLPGNDEAANEKALDLVEKELARLARLVQLPAQGPDGPQIRTGVPLKVEFTALKLSRAEPAEEAFIQNLLNSEPDLAKVTGPIVLPVFGRGRLLCSLYGADLNKDNIANMVRFLCGECSCQVKELNPGVDLLIAADWTEILNKAGPPKQVVQTPEAKNQEPAVAETTAAAPRVSQGGNLLTPRSGVQEPPITAETTPTEVSENVVVPPSISVEDAAEPEACHTCIISQIASHGWLTVAVGGAALLVLVTGFWVFLQRK